MILNAGLFAKRLEYMYPKLLPVLHNIHLHHFGIPRSSEDNVLCICILLLANSCLVINQKPRTTLFLMQEFQFLTISGRVSCRSSVIPVTIHLLVADAVSIYKLTHYMLETEWF